MFTQCSPLPGCWAVGRVSEFAEGPEGQRAGGNQGIQSAKLQWATLQHCLVQPKPLARQTLPLEHPSVSPAALTCVGSGYRDLAGRRLEGDRPQRIRTTLLGVQVSSRRTGG